MTGRHARRSRLPVVLAASVIAAGIAGGLALTRSGEPRGSAAPEPAVPPSPSVEVPSPTPSPTLVGPSPSPEPARGTIVIHGTGDVSLDPSYVPALRANGYGWAWSGLGGLFRRDDLTGAVHVYRPDDKRLDLQIPVGPDSTNTQLIPAALLSPGRWNIQVTWNGRGVGYYSEGKFLVGNSQ